MSFLDLLRFGFLNLWRRKLRTFLTILGMVIGITSIVVMVSLGLGIEKSTIDSFAATGSLTIIQVNTYKSVTNENGNVDWQQSSAKLDKNAVQSFRKLNGVTAVMPMVTIWGGLKSGKYVSDASILGVDKATAEAFGFALSEGDFPSETHGSRYDIVLSATTLTQFYNPSNYQQAVDADGNPLLNSSSRMRLTFDMSNIYPDWGSGQVTKGKMYNVNVVGVMSDASNDYSYYCLMDITAVEKLMKANSAFLGEQSKTYNQVLVKCSSMEDVATVKAAIDEMGFGTYSLMDAVNTAMESTTRVRLLLGAIGGVSLLIAAIGIMNTMMMSIYERTKEIGVIKVLGCRMSNIVELFLTEAAYIGFFGGLMGLGFSYLVSALLNKLLASSGLMSLIPAYLAFGAVAFSILVALLSGLYPALRAMRLSPLSAIRNE